MQDRSAEHFVLGLTATSYNLLGSFWPNIKSFNRRCFNGNGPRILQIAVHDDLPAKAHPVDIPSSINLFRFIQLLLESAT